jgi:hypothetical protein
MRCQSIDTDNSTSQVENTSRRISPDYAAENGQGCFGITTASLVKESGIKAGLDVTTFRCTQGCTCKAE